MARRFLGIAALGASLAVVVEAGVARIGQYVLALTDRLVDGLGSLGAEIVTPRGEGISSGIVAFSLAGRDWVELAQALGRRGFVTTFRRSGVRVSPHGYNTMDDRRVLRGAAIRW